MRTGGADATRVQMMQKRRKKRILIGKCSVHYPFIGQNKQPLIILKPRGSYKLSQFRARKISVLLMFLQVKNEA